MQRSEESHSGILYLILPLLLVSTTISFSQDVTLEYIFQDTNIVNPRPTLKYISPQSGKIYYYADEDFDGSLSLFDMNYKTGETYKYSDTGESASEFIILPNGDAAEIAAENLANFLGGVAMRNLGGLAVNKRAVPAQLRHARFKRAACAGAGEEEQHRQGLVSQQRMRLARAIFLLQPGSQLHHGGGLFQ